jgi:hypothetical protein
MYVCMYVFMYVYVMFGGFQQIAALGCGKAAAKSCFN